LPAIRSPGRPEEQQDDLAAKILEADRASLGRRQCECRSGLGRLIRLDLKTRGVRAGGPGAADGQQRQGEHDDEGTTGDDAAEALTAFKTSSGSSRSSGLSMTLTNLTVPVLSMMKYARFAYRYTGLFSSVCMAPYDGSICLLKSERRSCLLFWSFCHAARAR